MDSAVQATSPVAAQDRWTARAMVGRAFLSQNVSIGCTFGGFGIAVLPMQEKYAAGAGATGLALALCVLVMGVISPLVGALIGRMGLRWTMLIGTLISGLGYLGLAFAPSMTIVLALYALPIGVGLAMMGPFPASVLASNWYAPNPGVALGIANMPLLTALLPLVGVAIIRNYALEGFFLTLVGLHIVLVPFILGVRDGPADVVDKDHAPGIGHSHDHPAHVMLPARQVLGSPRFWLMCLGAGFLNGVGITGVSLYVPLLSERGVTAADSASLLSIIGVASMVGALAMGVLADRFGAARALAVAAAFLAVSWTTTSSSTAFVILAVAGLLQGICTAGVFPAVNILSGRLFGQESLARVIGLFGVVTLPITFLMPPASGLLRDVAQSYSPVVTMFIVGCALVAVLFAFQARKAETPAQLAAA